MGLSINFNVFGRSPFGFGFGPRVGLGVHLGPIGLGVGFGFQHPPYMFPVVEAYPFSPGLPFAPVSYPFQRTYGPALDLGNPHSVMDWFAHNNPYHHMIQADPLPPPPAQSPQQQQAPSQPNPAQVAQAPTAPPPRRSTSQTPGMG